MKQSSPPEGPKLDAAAMDRIIAAAGAEPSHREKLRESILGAEMLYRAGIRQAETKQVP
jgi:hypothetical protein